MSSLTAILGFLVRPKWLLRRTPHPPAPPASNAPTPALAVLTRPAMVLDGPEAPATPPAEALTPAGAPAGDGKPCGCLRRGHVAVWLDALCTLGVVQAEYAQARQDALLAKHSKAMVAMVTAEAHLEHAGVVLHAAQRAEEELRPCVPLRHN